jgi:predicted Co/Zn/Cd cation transporter (cation efflux family)
VKEFVVYTVMRILLFMASFGIVVGAMALAFDGRYNLFWAIILAFLISGVASFFILDQQREAFARRVEARAARASAAFDERKAREDQD